MAAGEDRAPGRVGVVGLGVMGGGMAHRLLAQGTPVVVWNRGADKAAPLAAAGAEVAATPAALAARVDTVLVSLADQAAVESVLFGPDGVLGALAPGGVVLNTSTVAPAFARALAERLAGTGHRILDACLLGNGQHAKDGELRFMVGGEPEVYERVEPLLASLGKEVRLVGGHGQGATLKLLLNMLMGIEMQALAEAVVLGQQAGLAPESVLQAIAASGFSSPVMRFKCGVMGRRAFERADFRLALMHKDLGLVRAEAQALGVPLAATDGAHAVLTEGLRRGLGELDCAAVLTVLEGMVGEPEPAP
ncbi:NAD(P)-dependent oxidoreductase [Kitasatospora viridis]|uniref:3-hydroxyisobutyrate dehydrogenase n=1 Tax=Kitasatospora viridis TaxID=281105 RepID=A0A561UCI2_9ACTN|nr:NAD(P)-dependent oxidoreductase [Kitasatospora viridis]TWF97067.1 3-hydroxyisobutyrate dehydrogenase [Kitasatospora viridis]